MRILFIFAMTIATALAFVPSMPQNRPASLLKMSDYDPDLVAKVKEKFASDPNFNPAADKDIMSAFEKEFSEGCNALESSAQRLDNEIYQFSEKVGFKIEDFVEKFKNVNYDDYKEKMSTPKSQYFKDGRPAVEGSAEEIAAQLEEMKAAVASKYPEIPFPDPPTR